MKANVDKKNKWISDEFAVNLIEKIPFIVIALMLIVGMWLNH